VLSKSYIPFLFFSFEFGSHIQNSVRTLYKLILHSINSLVGLALRATYALSLQIDFYKRLPVPEHRTKAEETLPLTR